MHTKAGQAQGFALFENGAAAQHALRLLSSLACATHSCRMQSPCARRALGI